MEPAMKKLPAAFPVMATLLVAATGATLLAATPAFAQDGCVTVEVQHVRPKQGNLLLQAFASADTYRKKPVSSVRVAAGDADTQRVQLCGLAAGSEMAVTMFQDLDGDGRMATNFVGMPTEPWGSSGAPGAFGPSWETGRVKLDGSVVVVKLSQ
jgi:uncharacterized protein (DUF2141 family)